MQQISVELIDRFADAFCSGRKGFSLKEIPEFFEQYGADVPTPASYPSSVTKPDFFRDCVRSLTPTNQRLALYDLCDKPPASSHPMPGDKLRREFLLSLVQADGPSPVSVELSSLTVYGARELWFTAASRVSTDPASAITAARALVESTWKTVLLERGETPDSSGDLGRLWKQIRRSLGVEASDRSTQDVGRLVGGLTQVVDGLAALSNAAGDRHGMPDAAKITDTSTAGLAVHAAGTIALFVVQLDKLKRRGATSASQPTPASLSDSSTVSVPKT